MAEATISDPLITVRRVRPVTHRAPSKVPRLNSTGLLERTRWSLVAVLCAATIAQTGTESGAAAIGLRSLCAALGAALLWSRLWPSAAGRAVAAVGAVALAILARDPWASVLPLTVLSALAARRSSGRHEYAGRTLVLAGAAGTLVLAIESSGLLWQELSMAAWSLSLLVSKAVSQPPLRIGPASPVFPAIVFALTVWLAAIVAHRPLWRWHAWLLVVLLAGGFVSLALNQIFLVTSLAGLCLFGIRWRETESVAVRPHLVANATLALSLCVLSALVLVGYSVGWKRPAPVTGHSIAFLDSGMRTFDYPGRDRLDDPNNEANFAVIHDLLRANGWQTGWVPANMSREQLRSYSMLGIINPNQPLPPESVAVIEGYVRDGGRLLVLGDHTNIGGIMGPLNQLLSFTGIEFRFDSAIPLDRPSWRWNNCLRTSWHPAFAGRTNEALGISVGASLSLSGDARALVVGDHAFSDWGNPRFGVSRLGDMMYNRGEQLGGLILAAQQRIGNGVVEVWGDTTGFQSTVMRTTYRSRLLGMSDLLVRTPWAVPRHAVLAGAAAIGLLGLVLFRSNALGVAIAAMSIALVGSLGSRAFAIADPLPRLDAADVKLVAFDSSHRPRFPESDSQTWLSGLTDLIRRGARVPISVNGMAEVRQSGASDIVIVDPTERYSDSECAELLAFVRDGGRVFISAGPFGGANLGALLGPLGLRIDDQMFGVSHRARRVTPSSIPLKPEDARRAASEPGTAINAEPQEFFSAYDADLGFKESHPIVVSDQSGVETLVTCWDRPIVVRKSYGSGSVVLIADPKFFTDANLYQGDSHQFDIRTASFVADTFGP